MPRHRQGAEGVITETCKIQKRGCSSPPSSSYVRFRRVILVGKRRGSTTPAPAWKIRSRSPSSIERFSQSSEYQPSLIGGNGMQAPVSARKLANALWGMNKITLPQMIQDQQPERPKKDLRARRRMVRSILPGSFPGHLSDPSPSHSFNSDTDRRPRSRTLVSSDIGNWSCLKGLKKSLVTSKELLTLLDHIGSVKEKNSSSASLVSALCAELDRACVQANHLVQEQMFVHNEISCLKKRFGEERSSWKRKEEKFRAAVQSIVEELESEKRSRRRAERLSKNLGAELDRMKASLLKAIKKLERERRSREIIEQVCNELVKGIGEDKAEVEELKRESAKAQEEVEKEMEMLQLADEWREERVQMKLSEAKFQFEEKNAAVDQLRNELEAFLNTKRTEEPKFGHLEVAIESRIEDQSLLIHPNSSSRDNDLDVDEREAAGEVKDGEEDDDGVNSVDSDLHSIELKMDNNNKSCIWSHATSTADDVAKLASFEEKNEAMISNCSGVLSKIFLNLGDELEQERISGSSDNKAHKLDQETYVSVKELRERMLAASRIPGIATPIRQSRSRTLQESLYY